MDLATSTLTQFSQWPMDWALLGIFAALLALESFSSGSTRTSAISLAFPIAFVITGWLPATFGTNVLAEHISTPYLQASLFTIVLIGIYVVIHRMIYSFGSAGGSVVNSILHGLSTALIIMVFWIQTPGLKDLWVFSPQIQLIFGEAYRAWWLAGSFAALAYTRG